MIYPHIVVGAGASGLFFSAAAENSGGGLILEKKSLPGIKFLLTGNGQCNITHGGSIKDFIPCYGPGGRVIRSCLYKYNNLSLIEFLHKNGVDTFIREDGKIFPKSMKAREILEMLLLKAEENGFLLRCDTEVTAVRRREKDLWEVCTNAGSFLCRKLILSGGGCSYPKTGSDGSLLRILSRDLHIRTVTPRPALSPVFVCDYPYGRIAGIALKKVQLCLFREKKKIAEGVDDLLFTHTNLSGPLILNLSKEMEKNDEIMLNYLYPCDKTSALDKINTAVKSRKTSLLNTLSGELNLPKNFLKILIERSGPSLKKISAALTEDRFSVQEVCGFEKAMATCGGIDLSEIDLKSMELKNHPGIYAIGEILDVDGRTGGYNLQFAYSSACAASSVSPASIKR